MSAPTFAPVAGVSSGRVVQCDVVWDNTIGAFKTDGRVSGHDSADNLRALSSKIRMRAKGAVTNSSAANNEHETELYTKKGKSSGDFIKGNIGSRNMAVCHKMSSRAVQQAIVDVANKSQALIVKWNQYFNDPNNTPMPFNSTSIGFILNFFGAPSSPQNDQVAYNILLNAIQTVTTNNAIWESNWWTDWRNIWTPIQKMVDAVSGSGWTNKLHGSYESTFDNIVQQHHKQATALLQNFKSTPNSVTSSALTDLADQIANSPANLFLGTQTINGSIQDDGDFNSTEITPTSMNSNNKLARRRLTMDSDQIRQLLGQLPATMNYVSHQSGLGSSKSTNRYSWAKALSNQPLANTFLSSSTDPVKGYAAL